MQSIVVLGGGVAALVADGRAWHLGKVAFEKWWLAPPGPRRQALGLAMTLGARAHGVPIEI